MNTVHQKIKERCKYIDNTDCCLIPTIQCWIVSPPPPEMPATQSILNIGGIETVLLIAEKKVHLLYERVFAAMCCINIHPR